MNRFLAVLSLAFALWCGAAHAQIGQGNVVNLPPAAGGGQAPCNAFGAASGKCHGGTALSIDITEPPYNAACDGTTDDSAAVTSAYATGREVYIPATAIGCVMGNIVLNGQNGVRGGNSKVVPLAGANFVFELTGKSSITSLTMQDTTAAGQTSGVVSTATVSSGGTQAATSLVVTGAAGPAFQTGQRLAILLDDGSRFTDYITSVSGTTINWTKALPFSAASGNKVWASFGLIYATCGALAGTVSDITFLGNWTGAMLDCPTTGSITGMTFRNLITRNGNLFGLICGRGCSANQFSDINITGGWINTETFNGDGGTTTFTIGPERIAFPQGVALTVTVGGVPKVLTTDFTIAASGQAITFNSAPASGTANIVISWRVWAAENLAVDTTGGSRASGDTFTAIEAGQADTACAFIGTSGSGATATTDAIVNSLCGPGANEVVRLDGNSALHIAQMELGRAPVNFKIVNAGSAYGDVRVALATSATLTTGYTGVPYVLDPSSHYLGRFINLGTAGSLEFANSALQYTTNTTLAASQSGACVTSGTQAAGTKLLNCASTTGTLAQLELSSSNTSIPAWDTILGVAASVTSCSNPAAGTHTCVTLSDNTTGSIANGVTLNFAGPTQPVYLSYKNALPNGSTLYTTHVGSPFTFSVPSGAHHLSGTLWGAGGGGGNGAADGAGLSDSGGAGGGAGAKVPFGPVDVAAAGVTSCTVTIGTGGAHTTTGGDTSISCNGSFPGLRKAGGGGAGQDAQAAAVSKGGSSGAIGLTGIDGSAGGASAGVFSIAGGSGVGGATPTAPGIAGAGGGGGATGTGGLGSSTQGAPSGGSAGGGCVTGTAVIGAQGATSDLGRATHGQATNTGISATGAGASGSGGAGGDAQITSTNGDNGGNGGWPGAGAGGAGNNCNGGTGTGGTGGTGADGGAELVVN